uniref:Uncharacterized protein n=1 Tax=Cannabis sativa TaxID=3483 RepID=A0A803PI80_CANSA
MLQGFSFGSLLSFIIPIGLDGFCSWYDNRWDFLGLQGLHKAFMLKRVAEEPLGHAAAIITDVLENAETNSVINASKKRALLQEMALRLS